jgi:hypothetical protein
VIGEGRLSPSFTHSSKRSGELGQSARRVGLAAISPAQERLKHALGLTGRTNLRPDTCRAKLRFSAVAGGAVVDWSRSIIRFELDEWTEAARWRSGFACKSANQPSGSIDSECLEAFRTSTGQWVALFDREFSQNLAVHPHNPYSFSPSNRIRPARRCLARKQSRSEIGVAKISQ